MKIVIDGFGGDHAPDEVLKGSVQAVKEYGIEVIVTGDEDILSGRMKALGLPMDGITLYNAEGIIAIEDNPMDILKEKAGTSMGVAFKLLADGKADAMIGAGSTAALVVGGTMLAKRIKGVKRPALAPIMPSTKNSYILLDGGANVECRPEMLQQFAIMGSCYMEKIMGVNKPRVGLLNVGAEEEKGRDLEHATYELLKNSPLNFVGNVEGRDVPLGAVDVIVTDGFTGNVFLKTVEGMGKFMKESLKEIFFANLKTKIGALMVKSKLGVISKKMDYKEVGGSPLLGTAKPVIKAHGSSDAKAFKNAFRQARDFVEKDVITEMTNALAQIKDKE